MFCISDVHIESHEGEALALLTFVSPVPVQQLAAVGDDDIRITGALIVRQRSPVVALPLLNVRFGDVFVASWCFNGRLTRRHLELLSSQDDFVIAAIDESDEMEGFLCENPPTVKRSFRRIIERLRELPVSSQKDFQFAASEFHSQFRDSLELNNYLREYAAHEH